MSVGYGARNAPLRSAGFGLQAVALSGAIALACVALPQYAVGQSSNPGWSNTSGLPANAAVPYFPPAPTTWTSAAPPPAQQQLPPQDVRPWMLAHRIASGPLPQTAPPATPQFAQPVYGTAPVLVAAPAPGTVPEWAARAPAQAPIPAAPAVPTRVSAPILVQQTAQANRSTLLGSTVPPVHRQPAPLKEGQGLGSGPYWARGIGLYATGWLNGAIPTINEITNNSDGAFAAGTLADDSANDGVIFAPGIAVGVTLQRYGFPIRAELEYTARSKIEYGNTPIFSNDATGTTFASVTKNQTLMVNTYLDLYRDGKSIQPYVGFGLGASWNKSDVTLTSGGNTVKFANRENEFAWSLIAGFGYQFSDAWLIDTRYRWTNYGAARFGPESVPGIAGDIDIQARDISAHELGIGLRYHF